MFSPITNELLLKAGWHEKYVFDITLYEQTFRQKGCPLPEIVSGFLQHYGGLYFVNLTAADNISVLYFDFDANAYLKHISGLFDPCGDCAELSRRLGLSSPILYPIGTSHEGHMELLMASDGMVFAVYDEFALFVGESGEDALEALCTGRELKQIPFEYPDE